MVAGALLAPRNSGSHGLLEIKPIRIARHIFPRSGIPPIEQNGLLPGKLHIDPEIPDVTRTDPPHDLS